MFVKTWKDKILDYEIETSSKAFSSACPIFLEKIRFSITRLKPFAGHTYVTVCLLDLKR